MDTKIPTKELIKQGYSKQQVETMQRDGISTEEMDQLHAMAIAEHLDRFPKPVDTRSLKTVRVVGNNPGDLKADGTVRKNRYRPRRPQSVVDQEKVGKARSRRSHPAGKQIDQEVKSTISASLDQAEMAMDVVENTLDRLNLGSPVDDTTLINEDIQTKIRYAKMPDGRVVVTSRTVTSVKLYGSDAYEFPTE